MLDTTPDQRRDLVTELEEAIAAAEIDAARHHFEAVGTDRPVVGHAGARQRLVEERVVMLRAARRRLLLADAG